METKKRISCGSICLVLFWIAFLGLLIALIFHQPIFIYLKNRERDAGWRSQIQRNLRNINGSMSYPDYDESAGLLRDTKMRAEFMNMRRRRYLAMLSEVKNSIPATVDTDRLPYDLRQKDEEQILYGLCSSGWKRLEDSQREEELRHLADEITLAHLHRRGRVLSGYEDIIGMMYRGKRLSDEDIQFLERQSGCDIIDASGYSIRRY